jgi:hypothetical protein
VKADVLSCVHRTILVDGRRTPSRNGFLSSSA